MITMGRPTKFNEKIGVKILELFKEGKTDEQVAEIIGVSPRTLNNWKSNYPGFLQSIRESKQIADELVEASLFARALGYSHPEVQVFFNKDVGVVEHETIKHYPPSERAIEFWLKNRQPKRWREKLQLDHNDLSKMSDEQLDAKIKALLEKMNKKNEPSDEA